MFIRCYFFKEKTIFMVPTGEHGRVYLLYTHHHYTSFLLGEDLYIN